MTYVQHNKVLEAAMGKYTFKYYTSPQLTKQ